MSMLKTASTSFSFLHFSGSHIIVCAYFQKLTNQSFSTKQLPSRRKPSGNICNNSEKKFVEVRISFFNNQSVRYEEKSGSKLWIFDLLFFLEVQEITSRQYVTRVWPIERGSYLLGASFWSHQYWLTWIFVECILFLQ